ncbi:MAG: fibronectin type III-like domain-contianing protein, partial [Bacteroidota bacterium]
FDRVYLEPGEEKTVSFTLIPRQISIIDNDFKRVLEPGFFQVSVGGKQPGFEGVADTPTSGVTTGRFEVVGERFSF